MALQVKDGSGNLQNLPLWVDSAFSASILNLTPVAAPTAVVVMAGVAAVVARLKRVAIGGLATTAGIQKFQLVKWSSAGTIGSAVGTTFPTIGTHAAGGAVNTSQLLPKTVGTANYTTLGTAAGIFRTAEVYLNIVTTGPSTMSPGGPWQWGDKGDMCPAVTGATDIFAIVSDGGTLPSGAKFDFDIQWEEGTA